MLKSTEYSGLISISAICCGVSVLLGALGSHALAGILSTAKLATFHKGSYYLMVHGISVILFLLVKNTTNLRISILAVKALLGGALIFSMSLFLVSFSELENLAFMKYFGMIAPIGGVLMILSWMLIGIFIYKGEAK